MMNPYIEWLKEKELYQYSEENIDCFKNIISNCLDVQDEELLIIGDKGYENQPISPIIAGGYYLAAQELGKNARIILQKPKAKGEKSDNEIIEALMNLNRGNVVIMSLSGLLGSIGPLGKSFRVYAAENYHRFISSSSLGKLGLEHLQKVIDTINVDYDELNQVGLKLKEKLDAGNEVRIKTAAGTDLIYGIEGIKGRLNTGIYTKPRTGGNVPAGEVYLPPKWKEVEGTVVIDGSSRYKGGTQLIQTPISMTIEKGEVMDIEGGKEADNLRETLDWACKRSKHPWGVRRIGELGIGINPEASIIGATIVDEKTKGTAHVAIGSNYWFGGSIYAIIHLDQVFKNPKIYIDGEKIEI